MAKVSISEGARMAGISRSYLYRKYITPGLLSTEKDNSGNTVVDTAEIIRVFGQIRKDSEQATEITHFDAVKKEHENIALQAEIQLLREQLAAAAERERAAADREKWYQEQIASTTRLLEHRPAADPTPEPQKKRWWQFS